MNPERGLPRWVEVPLALAVLLLASPVLMVTAVLVAVTSHGPVLFRQQRVGRWGIPFTLLKFRTMPLDSGGLGETLRRGSRVTPVGRMLRALKIDELPELWNVVRGDMALVGPRPEVPEFVDITTPLWKEVLNARPGVTDPVTLRLRSEEQLLAKAGDAREGFYRFNLQPYKLRGYRDYLAVRTWKTDVRVLWRSVVGIVLPSHANPPSEDKLRRGRPLDGPRTHFRLGLLNSASRFSGPLLIAACDLSLVTISNYLAFWLRFDGAIPREELRLWFDAMPALLVVRGLVFSSLGIFKGLWRYTTVSDLRAIIVGVVGSSALFYGLIHALLGVATYPRSIFLIDSFVLICLLGGLRLAYRMMPRRRPVNRDRRLLIVGAGNAAEALVREIRHALYHRYLPIGFIDEDGGKRGHQIHGLPILGTIDDLATVMVEHDPDEVLIALPEALSADFGRIMGILDRFNAAVTTLPRADGVPRSGLGLSHVRPVALEDLLPHRSSRLTSAELLRDLAGKRVLITGAAGTVGAEICQLLVGVADALVLFDRDERGLSKLMDHIGQISGRSEVRPVIGDVADERAIRSAVSGGAPDIIVHAANYRHERLLASNVCEAVRNNVLGTRRVAEAAAQYGVERVLVLSNRCAADPTNVGGATLWLAESVLRAAATTDGSGQRFAALRLGPLLSQDDGILRRFAGQIAAGRPVTVSHPAAEQIFLLPTEAAHFTLRLAVSRHLGGLFAASVGTLRVVDLARNLIRLSGRTPDEEVPIAFIGLDPGERLIGSLIGPTEAASDTGIAGILQIAPPHDIDLEALSSEIQRLELMALDGDTGAVLRQLAEIVPRFDAQYTQNRQLVRDRVHQWIGGRPVSGAAH